MRLLYRADAAFVMPRVAEHCIDGLLQVVPEARVSQNSPATLKCQVSWCTYNHFGFQAFCPPGGSYDGF